MSKPCATPGSPWLSQLPPLVWFSWHKALHCEMFVLRTFHHPGGHAGGTNGGESGGKGSVLVPLSYLSVVWLLDSSLYP